MPLRLRRMQGARTAVMWDEPHVLMRTTVRKSPLSVGEDYSTGSQTTNVLDVAGEFFDNFRPAASSCKIRLLFRSAGIRTSTRAGWHLWGYGGLRLRVTVMVAVWCVHPLLGRCYVGEFEMPHFSSRSRSWSDGDTFKLLGHPKANRYRLDSGLPTSRGLGNLLPGASDPKGSLAPGSPWVW